MRNGRRWLALDADLFSNPFTIRLLDRFGAAGVVTWVAFLCACKRSPTPGVFVYTSDSQALIELGIYHVNLQGGTVDKWSLDVLWTFTGQQKQTKRTRHGGRTYVTCSHYGRWQKNAQRQDEAERKSRSRYQNNPDIFRTAPGQAADKPRTTSGQKRVEIEKEIETPLPPKGADASQRQNGKGNYVDPQAARTLKASLRGDQ